MLALAQKQAPQVQPAPVPQVVERVVEVPDPVAQYKLERLEAELGEAAREREAMQRSVGGIEEAIGRGAQVLMGGMFAGVAMQFAGVWHECGRQ